MPSGQARKSEGFYFVVVDGVPPYCQWQELKDYLRDSIKVNPGYANVLKINEDGTRVGFCPLRNRAEANKAFEYLVAEGWQGLNIRVSIIWKADLSSEQIERRRGPEQSRRRRMTNTTPALLSMSSLPRTTRPATATTPASPYNMTAVSQALPAQTYSPASPPQMMPPYNEHQQVPLALAARTLPSLRPASNFRREDLIYTDQQSIHISRLPYETKLQDLQNLLSRFGTVSDVFIKRGTEKRCSATAKYDRASEAARAIQELDGKRMQKLTLVVRLDRSEAGSTTSAPSTSSHGSDDSDSSSSRPSYKGAQTRNGPLVVNGALGPGYHKRRAGDDDSESVFDSGEDQKPRAIR